MRPASELFQEIDSIRERHPNVREVLIDCSSNSDYDRIVTGFDGATYCSWITCYKNQYWDDEDELRDYIYETTELDEDEIGDIIAGLDVFDAIIIYGV